MYIYIVILEITQFKVSLEDTQLLETKINNFLVIFEVTQFNVHIEDTQLLETKIDHF